MFDLIAWQLDWNLLAAWVGICLGLLTGAAIGLGFDREQWLGGYASWPRRLMRLGHISFFGIALLNISLVVTAVLLELMTERAASASMHAAGLLMIAGAILMPTICFLSAWRRVCRHAFFMPVLCLVGAAGITTVNLFMGVLR
jgi:hypothetical protein